MFHFRSCLGIKFFGVENYLNTKTHHTTWYLSGILNYPVSMANSSNVHTHENIRILAG